MRYFSKYIMPLKIPDNRSAMKLLVLRLSSMGDCILVAPLFSVLKKRFPGASIAFVTGSDYAPLFRDDPRLSSVAGIGDDTPALPEAIFAQEWDLVVDLQNNRQSRGLCAQVRTKSRIGLFDKQHMQRFLLLVFRMNFYDTARHVAARYIEAAGGNPHAEELPAPELFFNKDTCARIRADIGARFGLDQGPCLALFPFSAWKNKEWPAEYFKVVGRHFCDKGWNVVIVGGPQDVARAETMQKRIGGRCVQCAGVLSLYECGCLLTGFDLALGNDTGLAHLARACGVKTGTLYGPTTRHFGFYPYGAPSFMVFENRLCCRPCHAHGGSVCVRPGRPCMKMTSAARVIAGLEELAGAP
jgi:heptosyltransferase II